MKLPVYNCIIDENPNDNTGIYAVSFVDSPANETDFITLSNNAVQLKKDSAKQILTGVILKPDQLIYRNSQQLGEHYITFSADQIEKIALKMMKTALPLYNTTHEHQLPLIGNYLTELWIVKNPENDKSNALGFADLPKGTLMCSYKVENRDYWEKEVMTGNVKGFSLEGFFEQELNLSKLNKSCMKKKKLKLNTTQKAVLRGVCAAFGVPKMLASEIEAIEKDDVTDSGETFREFTLSDGNIVKVDTEGFATLDGEQMQSGEHVLSDGNIMVIDAEGYFIETETQTSENGNPEEATAAQTLSKKRQKLETEVSDETIDSLKAKIAELERVISELQTKADEAETKAEEAQSEIENLKKQTPSAQMAVQSREAVNSELSYTDRMAKAIKLKKQRK